MKMRRNWQKSREMTMYFPKANIAVVNNEKSNIKIHLKKSPRCMQYNIYSLWSLRQEQNYLSVVADPRSSGVARFEVKRRNGSETWLYFLICLRRCQANKRARLGSALDYHCGPRWTMRRGWKSMLRFTCSCWTGDICTTRTSRVAPVWTKVFSPVRLRTMR